MFSRIINQLLGSRQGSVALPVLRGPARGLWVKNDRAPVGPDAGAAVVRRLKGLSELVQKGWTVWDCGSTEGLSTIIFSKFVGVDGMVVSFEPDRSRFLNTYDNANLNGCNNILFLFASIGGPARAKSFQPPICPKALSLDDAYSDSEVPIPHVIRIDLEGTAASSLNHCERLVREQRPLFVVDRYTQDGISRLWDFARGNGYTLQSLEDGTCWKELSEVKGSILCFPMTDTAQTVE